MPVTRSSDPTFYLRHFLTPALGMPIAAKELDADDAQGSVAFFFHENKRKDGSSSARVLGVSNCHVLRKHTGVDYEVKGAGAPRKLVRVAGKRRFQRALEDISVRSSDLGTEAEFVTRAVVSLNEELSSADAGDRADLEATKKDQQAILSKTKADIDQLQAFYYTVTAQWSDANRRNIGHVDWAPKVAVDDRGLRYAFDLATFELDESRFSSHFKGNVVDLGAKYTVGELTRKFHPHGYVHKKVFEFPADRQLRISGCVPCALLVDPDGLDANEESCLIVMKYGNTTDLTVGRCAGLEAYICDDLGQESIELAVYNYDLASGPFSAKGDSGSLIFDGLGRMVGILHSRLSRGTGHVTFATPAWWIIEKLKVRYPHADFDRQSF